MADLVVEELLQLVEDWAGERPRRQQERWSEVEAKAREVYVAGRAEGWRRACEVVFAPKGQEVSVGYDGEAS